MRLKDEVDAILDRIEVRAVAIERRLMKRFTAAILYAASIIFFALTVYFFFREYLSLSNTFSFLIVAVLLLIVGLIIKGTERRSDTRNY